MSEEMIIGVDLMHRRAGDFVRALRAGERAVVVGLEGDLGAGKTTLFQGVAKNLGVIEHTTSPTFVIQKTYRLKGQPFENLIHIDAYRLKSARELEALGWKELLTDRANLIFLEWPERVRDALPAGTHTIKLRFVDEQTRGLIEEIAAA